MRILEGAGPEEVAVLAAAEIARRGAEAIALRGRFDLAVSGGRTPGRAFEVLAEAALPWDRVRLFQVDERCVPADHPDRNLRGLRVLTDRVPVEFHAMPVETTDGPGYAALLTSLLGTPPVFDLVQLGLGPDGHTASLVPGDPAEFSEADVAVTAPYNGWGRMTLTFPLINRARAVLWIVTGAEKGEMLARMLRRDPSIPAGRVVVADTVLVADRGALGA